MASYSTPGRPRKRWHADWGAGHTEAPDLSAPRQDRVRIVHHIRTAIGSSSTALVGLEADRPAGLADAAGGDEHVGAAPRSPGQRRLALLQVGDRSRHAAAERGVDRRRGGAIKASPL